MQSSILTTSSQIANVLSFIEGHTEFAFDTETDGLSWDRRWIGFSFAVKIGDVYTGWYIPLYHEKGDDLFSPIPSNAPLDCADKLIREIFKPANKVWIHNAKFDLKVLRNEGYDVENLSCEILDTICVSWLLEPERMGGHGLKSLVPTILHKDMGSFEQFKLYKKNSYAPIGTMGKYAIEDAVLLLELAHALYPCLSDPLKKVFHELEMPLVLIMEEVEHYGFRLDVDTLKELGVALKDKVDHIEKDFKKLFGDHAQIASTQWLSNNLVGNIWGIRGELSKNGKYSTDANALEAWASGEVVGTSKVGSKVAKKVLEYRKASKLYSTYCKKLVDTADSKGRIHGSFNQWGTGTGRFSSSKPNLQNIPSGRSKEGDLIRRAFIAEDGYKLIVADYSQVELRVTAHLSGDPIMTKIYQENGDIHQMTADACNCARFDAKAINFGLIYKMGAKTLSGQIDKTPAEAQDYIDKYFENYRGVAEFQDKLIAECRKRGYTWTITGRRRPLRNIDSSNFGLKNADERKAINTQVQGSAADIIKIGMRNFYRTLREQGYSSEDFRIIGQVHDEVVVEVKENLAELVCNTLQHEMENAVKLNVPLIAEPSIGDSWGEAK
tara:strand:+ start:37981 stop:39807 length:1827 start_codon:yes stop_codon:yes gene_type:complete